MARRRWSTPVTACRRRVVRHRRPARPRGRPARRRWRRPRAAPSHHRAERGPMSRARLRLVTVVSASCLVVAGGLGIAALVTARSDDAPVSAPAASLAVAPSTVAPAVGLPPPAAADERRRRRRRRPHHRRRRPRCRCRRWRRWSARRSRSCRRRSSEPPAPVRLTIDALGVDVPVRPVGVEPDGQLEIPDETEVGWYRLGASPGEAGASVLAGHVNWNRVDGPFVRLVQLEPGAARHGHARGRLGAHATRSSSASSTTRRRSRPIGSGRRPDRRPSC